MTRTRDVATQGGLVLLNTTTFTSQSSVSINNVFSAAYDNYKIIGTHINTSTTSLGLRVRSGGTDLTTSTYKWVAPYWQSVTGGGVGVDAIASGTTVAISFTGSTVQGFFETTIANPYLTKNTHFTGTHQDNRTNLVGTLRWGVVDNILSYDGFTILPDAGTTTGTISVYGMRK